MWCIPDVDDEFIKIMDDVLEVYERPYDPKRPVVCLDEKLTQLLLAPRGEILEKLGKRRKEDYQYDRAGTQNIFVAVEPKGGKRILRVTDRRTKRDFAKFIKFLVTKKYAEVDKLVLVTDNLNTHTKKAIHERYGKAIGKLITDKIEWHYTPKHASWLDMAEIEIGIMSRAILKNRVGSKYELIQQVKALQNKRNALNSKINWQFTREKAREKFCKEIK